MPRRCLYAVGLTIAAALAAWAAWPNSPTKPADYDLTAARPETIPPGTVVEPKNHPGWSDLVLKSHPRIRKNQLDKVNDLTARMAGWMSTAFLADVQKVEGTGGPRFRLRTVGLGLATAINGKDTVVTADTGAKLGADVGFIGRSILTTGYERQGQSAVVLRSPAFWLVDTPVCFAAGGKNGFVRFRYALLVDEATGRLDVLVWRIDADGKLGDPRAVWLNPEAVDAAELVVDENEITLGVPSEKAFAVDRLPASGGAVGIPQDVRKLVAQGRYTAADAAALEVGLRKMTGGR